MHSQELDRLNGVLSDNLGRNRFGGPLYFWSRSRDIRIPVLSKETCQLVNGIYRFAQRYVWEPQVERDCWVLAGWIAPVAKSIWAASFGNLPWPAEGMYYVTDIILKPGVEPNDAATNDVIGKIKRRRRLTDAEVWEFQREKTARIEREEETAIGDYVRDKAVNHIPGVCGPVSYPEKDLCPK